MHITRLEAWPVELKLTEPYTIAYDEISTAANVFVRLHTDGPLVGHGCAAPDPAVTEETAAGVLAALQQSAGVVAGLTPALLSLDLDLVRSLKGGSSLAASRRRRATRSWLITSQVAPNSA